MAWLSRDSTKDAVSMSHRSVAIFAVGEWRWRGDLDAIHHRAWSSPRSRVQRDCSARRRSPAGGRQSQRGCLQKCVKRKVTDRENSFARPRAHVVRATCFLGIPGSKHTRRGRSMQGLCLAGQVALVARARGVPDAALRGRFAGVPRDQTCLHTSSRAPEDGPPARSAPRRKVWRKRPRGVVCPSARSADSPREGPRATAWDREGDCARAGWGSARLVRKPPRDLVARRGSLA